MRSIFFAAMALGLALTTPISAATVKAELTAVALDFTDDMLIFKGQALSPGDEFKISIYYDADRVPPEWRDEQTNSVFVKGGSAYDYDEYGYLIASPIISATVQVGEAIYIHSARHYGAVNYYWSNMVGNGNYNFMNFDARTSDFEILYIYEDWQPDGPPVFNNPTFEGPYSFDVVNRYSTDPHSTLNLACSVDEQGPSPDCYTHISFNIIHGEIALYDGEPPQPAPIPLPASALLVLTGLSALFGLRRTRRAK